MRRARVAVIHPHLRFGGSEIGALRGIETLKRDFDVTLITGGPVDLGRLNDYYGTSLARDDFRILYAPMPWGLLNSTKFAALKGAFLQRCVRRVAPEFDLMISAYNCCDFGRPGIQLIADFSFIEEWRNRLHPSLKTHKQWWYGDSPLRRAYLGLCNLISPANPEAWRRNITIAKCEWAAGLLRQRVWR